MENHVHIYTYQTRIYTKMQTIARPRTIAYQEAMASCASTEMGEDGVTVGVVRRGVAATAVLTFSVVFFGVFTLGVSTLVVLNLGVLTSDAMDLVRSVSVDAAFRAIGVEKAVVGDERTCAMLKLGERAGP